MDKNIEPSSSVSHRSPSPSADREEKVQTTKKYAEWLDKPKEDPLRSSLDEMLEALDKWEPTDKSLVFVSSVSSCITCDV